MPLRRMAKWYFHFCHIYSQNIIANCPTNFFGHFFKEGAKIKMPSDDLPYLEKYGKIN